MAIVWSKDLAVGVAEIDSQHRELFDRINKLLDACNAGKGKEEVSGVIGFLEDYIITHFKAEEAVQKKYSYPEYNQHCAMHREFVAKVSGLKKNFAEKGVGPYLTILTNEVVVDWLINHISKVDRSLGAFLKGRVL